MSLGERTVRRAQFLINCTFWALFIGLFWLAGRVIVNTLLPFAAAFALAAILQKPLSFLEKRYNLSHRFAATALCILTLSAIGGITVTAVWQGGIRLLRFLRSDTTLSTLQTWGNTINRAINTLITRLDTLLPHEYATALQNVATRIEDTVLEYGGELLTALSGKVMSFTVGALPRFLLATFFFVLALIFFTKDFSKVTAFGLRQIPKPQQKTVLAAVTALKETALSVSKAYLLLGLVTFLQLLIGFWIVNMPHPFIWAAITALVDALPILGVGIILFPVAMVRFISGNIWGGVAVLLIYAVITVVRNLLQPRFVSRETGLPPLITLLSLYVGWRTAGVFGLLSAPIFSMVLLRLQREGHIRIFK